MSTLRVDTLQTTDSAVTRQVAELVNTTILNAAIAGIVIPTANVTVVSSVAALKALTGAVGYTYITNGYYAAGDGGGNTYFFDSADTTSAEDGGSVIVGQGTTRFKPISPSRLSLEQFGARGNFTTDDSARVQAAFDWAANTGQKIVAGSRVYRLNSTIAIKGSVNLVGVPVNSAYRLSMGAQTKYGTWFYLNHSNVGFNETSTTTGVANTNGTTLDSFGTIRNQPTVATGWAPTDHQWDIYIAGYGACELRNLMLLNATRGIYCEQRAYIDNVRGQCFKAFIFIDNNYDTTRITNCHTWPFWDETTIPMNYTRANLQAYTFLRSDNPMISNCFAYSARFGIYLGYGQGGGAGPTGVTSRLKGSNLDFDACYYGIFCQTDGVQAQFTNVTYVGWTATSGSVGIYSSGAGNTLEFQGLRITNANDQAIYVDGNNNRINVSNLWIDSWNTGNSSKPAIACVSPAVFSSSDPIRALTSQGNGAAILSGTGKFYVPLGSGLVASATSDANGLITVTHSLGVIASVVQVQSYSANKVLFIVTGRTNNSFTVTLLDAATGATMPSATVAFSYNMYYTQ